MVELKLRDNDETKDVIINETYDYINKIVSKK
jgi:hypothetical protein